MTNTGLLVSDGWLTVSGGDAETGPALINAEDAEITAAGDLVLELADLQNFGVIASTGGRLLVTSGGDIANGGTGTLYGESLLQLLGDGAIVNDGGALLAAGDLVVGGVSGLRAGRFSNRNGGLTETFEGDVQIAASVFENLAPEPLVTEDVAEESTEVESGTDCSGGTKYDCTKTTTTTTVTTEVAAAGPPSQIISAADMRLSGGTGVNAYSLISATGDLHLDFVSLANQGRDLTETTEVVRDIRHRWRRGRFHSHHETHVQEIDEPVVVEVGAVFATIEAGDTITGTITGYLENGAVADGVVPTTGGGLAPGVTGSGGLGSSPLGSDLSGVAVASVGNPALIVTNADPDADYLVETRHDFVDLGRFLSSDYVLSVLDYDSEAFSKRLGDAYVETQFIRAQLFGLTGRRILDPGIDERSQIQALYDNAIDAAGRLDLSVGIALSAVQVASLREDIVWLEEIVVAGQRGGADQRFRHFADCGGVCQCRPAPTSRWPEPRCLRAAAACWKLAAGSRSGPSVWSVGPIRSTVVATASRKGCRMSSAD